VNEKDRRSAAKKNEKKNGKNEGTFCAKAGQDLSIWTFVNISIKVHEDEIYSTNVWYH